MPIQGQGDFGLLSAQGFKLVDKGKIIYFTGKSKLTLHPGARKSKK
jgi:lipopolysaccharide export system protein LptC